MAFGFVISKLIPARSIFPNCVPELSTRLIAALKSRTCAHVIERQSASLEEKSILTSDSALVEMLSSSQCFFPWCAKISLKPAGPRLHTATEQLDVPYHDWTNTQRNRLLLFISIIGWWFCCCCWVFCCCCCCFAPILKPNEHRPQAEAVAWLTARWKVTHINQSQHSFRKCWRVTSDFTWVDSKLLCYATTGIRTHDISYLHCLHHRPILPGVWLRNSRCWRITQKQNLSCCN